MNTTNQTQPASQHTLTQAEIFGQVLAQRMFSDRAGHGGGPLTKRNLRREQVALVAQTGYETGEAYAKADAINSHAALLARVAALTTAAPELMAALESLADASWNGPVDADHPARAKAAEALAKAKGQL